MQQFGNGLKFCDLPCLLMNSDWMVGEGEGFDSAGGATSTRSSSGATVTSPGPAMPRQPAGQSEELSRKLFMHVQCTKSLYQG